MPGLAHGCARYRCERCAFERVTALSCKGRGFCPRCIGRRMTRTARELVQRVLPHVRVRQWVLSRPFALRVRLAFDHDATLALGRIAEREIDRRYRALARQAGVSSPRGAELDEDEQALATAYVGATRRERHWADEHDLGIALPTRGKARIGEWDLNAEVAVGEHDRGSLEPLCRHLLGPPLALDRLVKLDDGRICLALKRPWPARRRT